MFGITGLTVPAWDGSFQRCLLCRCGEAERERVWSKKESVLSD